MSCRGAGTKPSLTRNYLVELDLTITIKKKPSGKYRGVLKNLLDNKFDCSAARDEPRAMLCARGQRLCAAREHCKQKNVNKLRHDATSASPPDQNEWQHKKALRMSPGREHVT